MVTWQYAGAYLVSVVTSPVILLGFVIGVLVGWLLPGGPVRRR